MYSNILTLNIGEVNMLKKIASNYLEKIAFSWFADEEDEDDLDKVYKQLAREIPENAINADNGVWYSDDFYEESTPKSTIKNLKGYNHEDLVNHIQSKLLPKLYKEYKSWLPKHIKSLRLKGITRMLSDSRKPTPYDYILSVGSDDDNNYRFNDGDHDLILPANNLKEILVEG